MNKILLLYNRQDKDAASIVQTAMQRSFTTSQIDKLYYSDINSLPEAVVLINPKVSQENILNKLKQGRRKILILGKLTHPIDKEIGLFSCPLPEEASAWAKINISTNQPFNATPVTIRYKENHSLSQSLMLNPRYLCRYDFNDEWNNLGYGRISTDGSIWSVCNKVEEKGALPLAWLTDDQDKPLSLYAALLDRPSSSILWFNRQVGPIDSLEWHIIERFFADYRDQELICLPYLSEIPYGFKGAVSMRLDCDQAISSARPLFELYKNEGLPISLAVTTGLKMNPDDIRLLNEVVENKGAIVSHSHNHYPNWGGNYATALKEATTSKLWLEENIEKSKPIKYAASPFHQNPAFAINALADADYKGFVGGIIHNDPEFLLGRAGQAPLVKEGIISHSQQCMLHGDCFHRYGSSLEPYKQSFNSHLAAGAIFGYFDHPFSDTYRYGWSNENERLGAHQELIDFIKGHSDIWWCNLNDCLDFVAKKASAALKVEDGERAIVEWNKKTKDLPPLRICWRGKVFKG